MANTQTTVPLFVANQVLTAAQQNASAGTGVPVFATTVTRDAAFGGSNKALAKGQLCYLESTNVTQYYDGASWLPVGASSGLTLVSATTIGTTVASVTVSSAFSATYDSYKVVISGGVGTTTPQLGLTFGATATGYYYGLIYNNYSSTVGATGGSNAAQIAVVGTGTSTGISCNMDITNPYLASQTLVSTGMFFDTGNIGAVRGYLSNTTSYTAFTLTCGAGTLTGGTIRVYGYANS